MANRPYSTRFLLVSVPNLWQIYGVPAGYRAVVKSLCVYGGPAAGGQAAAVINNAQFAAWQAPGPESSLNMPLSQVAYAGETLQGLVTAGAMRLLMSGYLLLDDAPLADGHEDVTWERAWEPEVLPGVS